MRSTIARHGNSAESNRKPATKIKSTTKMKVMTQSEVSAEPTVSERISPVEAGPEQVSAQLIAGQAQVKPGRLQPRQDQS